MNVIKLFSISQGMSSIRRYSGVHLLKEESVMEHTGFVCLFTYFICEKLNHECEPEHLINTGLALEKSVVHDMDEVITGDIPRPTKYFNSETKKVFDKMAKIGMTQVVNQLELQNINTFLNWEKAKDGKEGKIVALADLASVVYKIWDEMIMLSNNKLMRQAMQVSEYMYDFSLKIKNTEDFTNKQKEIIIDVLSQFVTIIGTITENNTEIYGTINCFKEQ